MELAVVCVCAFVERRVGRRPAGGRGGEVPKVWIGVE